MNNDAQPLFAETMGFHTVDPLTTLKFTLPQIPMFHFSWLQDVVLSDTVERWELYFKLWSLYLPRRLICDNWQSETWSVGTVTLWKKPMLVWESKIYKRPQDCPYSCYCENMLQINHFPWCLVSSLWDSYQLKDWKHHGGHWSFLYTKQRKTDLHRGWSILDIKGPPPEGSTDPFIR